MLLKNKYPLKEFIQWLILIGSVSERWYELAILIIVNFIILFNARKLFLTKGIFITFAIIFFISIVNIKIVGYSYEKFVQQMLILVVYIVSYYNFFKYINIDIDSFFKKYLKLAYIISLLGLIQFFTYALIRINIFGFLYSLGVDAITGPGILRISSVVTEPSQLSNILTPAVVYILLNDNGLVNVYKSRHKLIVLFTAIMTFSSLMFVIIILMLIYKYIVYKRNMLVRFFSIIIITLSAFFFLIYDNKNLLSSSDVNIFSDAIMKIDDSISVVGDLEPNTFEGLNLSSYATMSNLWVAINAPQRILGTGLGTHYQNYYSTYESTYDYYGLNAEEGYSLANRIFSEFGFLGLLITMILLVKNFNKTSIINITMFFFILYQLVRGGHYVRYGTIMYFFLYYYSGLFYQQLKNAKSLKNTNIE